MVTQGFVQIVVQLKSPVVFAVDTGGISNLCHGGRVTMDWCNIGVDGDEESYDGRGGSILGIGHHESEGTVDSTTKLCENGCHIDVEFCTGGLGTLEGGFLSYLGNRC